VLELSHARAGQRAEESRLRTDDSRFVTIRGPPDRYRVASATLHRLAIPIFAGRANRVATTRGIAGFPDEEESIGQQLREFRPQIAPGRTRYEFVAIDPFRVNLRPRSMGSTDSIYITVRHQKSDIPSPHPPGTRRGIRVSQRAAEYHGSADERS